MSDIFAKAQETGSKTEVPRGQAGLPDDGTGGADGQLLTWVWHDDDASAGVLVFGVAASLRDKEESVSAEYADDFRGTQPFRHPRTPARH